MEKEFKKAYEKLIAKHIEEDDELEKDLKRSGRYEKGFLDANHEDFKKLHLKHWEEIKELCNKYGVKYEDKR